MPPLELDKTVIRQNPNLVAYYRLENGALTTDSKGSYTLTNNNSVSETTGIFGGAADFGTANTNKRLSRSDVLGLDLSEYTISCWVKINTEITTGYYDLVSLEHATNGYSVLYYSYNAGTRRVVFDYSSGSNTYNINLGTTNWYFLTGTKTSTSQKLYVNGVLVSTLGPGGPLGGGTNRLAIGSTTAGNANFANAIIDDVAIFNRALSPEEIKDIYEQHEVGEFQPQPNLVGLYHLSDTTDYSGNNYNLTNNNSVTFSDYGKFFKCANFGTANTNKNLSISNALGIDGTAITMSCWVKLNTEITTGTYEFVASQNATSRVGYLIWYNYNSGDRTLNFYRLKQNVAFQGPAYSITLGTTNWYHLALTYDLTTIKGYVNGQLVASSAASGSGSGTVTTYTNIGGSATVYSSAVIDEVAIFNRALSQQEIARYYQWSLGRFAKTL